MLVLLRKNQESVMIGDDIKVTVVSVLQNKVKLGFQAPKDVVIDREEVYLEKCKERENDT